jgi:dienelactone hydrolase
MEWTPSPIQTSWDDLLDGIETAEAWADKRPAVWDRFLSLIREEAAPKPPSDLNLHVERQWDAGEFTIQYVSYQVEGDERAHAYVGIPSGDPPPGGYPGVVCLHGTTNWGARRTLRLPPESGDPHEEKGSVEGKDFARQLVRNGYVTISPEHFCCAARVPEEGPYDTAAFYRRHPDWSAVGKYIYDSVIATTVLADRSDVDANRLGVTGHSLGGHGAIWLAAYDDRIKCSAPSCSAQTFRENPNPIHWSRDFWYIYFPQLREQFLAGETVACDFHEMFALIAPRPVLDRYALNDGDPQSQKHRTMMHLKIHELYRLLGHEPAHAFLAFGDGHFIPDLSQEALVSWMDRWLKHGGHPLENWDDSLTSTQ